MNYPIENTIKKEKNPQNHILTRPEITLLVECKAISERVSI